MPSNLKITQFMKDYIKAGPVYNKWYRLKQAGDITEGHKWSEYSDFAEYVESESDRLGISGDFVIVNSAKGFVLNEESLHILQKREMPRYAGNKQSIYSKWTYLKRKYDICPEWDDFSNFMYWYVENVEYGDKIVKLSLSEPAGPDTMAMFDGPTLSATKAYEYLDKAGRIGREWYGADGKLRFAYWHYIRCGRFERKPLFCSKIASDESYMKTPNMQDDLHYINDGNGINRHSEGVEAEMYKKAFSQFESYIIGSDACRSFVEPEDRVFKTWFERRMDFYIT